MNERQVDEGSLKVDTCGGVEKEGLEVGNIL